MSFQRRDNKDVMYAFKALDLVVHAFFLRIARIDKLIELAESFVKIESLSDFFCIVADRLSYITQAFKGIARSVYLFIDRSISKLRSCFNKQHEQHTVHIAQALQSELCSVNRFFDKVLALTGFQVINDLVSEYLNTFTKCIFEIL